MHSTKSIDLPKKIALCALGCLISIVSYAQAPGQPVSPNQLFPSNILNVHSPDSDGWVITGVRGNGISFGKKGRESSETFGAQVVIFEMPPLGSNEAFISFVKKRIATMNPPPRFLETASSYQYVENRDYPCVNVHIAFDDTAAVTPTGREQLKLKVVSLYCRHPVQQQIGFIAAYSYRGRSIEYPIESMAQSFIESINVPKL